MIAEVKKYNQNSRVSINEVQRLLGVAVAAGAQCAMIVTSGRFTSTAHYFADSSPVKIVLFALEELIASTRESVTKRFS